MSTCTEDVLTLKVVIIGECNVGKSCLLLRFMDDRFDGNLTTTIGIDMKSKTINSDGHKVKLQLRDTAGQEKFDSLNTSYYRDIHGTILVYDVCERASFEKLESWLEKLRMSQAEDDVVKMVVGNKIDKGTRQVSRNEGLNFAEKHQMLFMEASAKTSDGVQNTFEKLIQKIIKTPALWKTNKNGNTVTLDESEEPKKSCNC